MLHLHREVILIWCFMLIKTGGVMVMEPGLTICNTGSIWPLCHNCMSIISGAFLALLWPHSCIADGGLGLE